MKVLEMNKIFKHVACRNSVYARTIQRFAVPDESIAWSVEFEGYAPHFYEAPGIQGKPWADPVFDDSLFKPKFNELDGQVNRVSHIGSYQVVDKLPLNPFGRTGITGRGILGRYGVNHAADPIVSTWKRNEANEIVKNDKSGKPVLRVLCIERGDTKEIALPGGMVDPGEQVSVTLKREFVEEALNGKIQEADLDEFFKTGAEIYKGYVDDPRNTDNGEDFLI
jgi:ADP-ribose pyrophosphatase